MSSAIAQWTIWIAQIWNGLASNIILSIPLLLIAISIIFIMFDKIKSLIK